MGKRGRLPSSLLLLLWILWTQLVLTLVKVSYPSSLANGSGDGHIDFMIASASHGHLSHQTTRRKSCWTSGRFLCFNCFSHLGQFSTSTLQKTLFDHVWSHFLAVKSTKKLMGLHGVAHRQNVVSKNPHLNILGEEIQQRLLEKQTREIQFLTLQKTNMAMNNPHFQWEIHLQMVVFPLSC